jgi:hypothetical protein
MFDASRAQNRFFKNKTSIATITATIRITKSAIPVWLLISVRLGRSGDGVGTEWDPLGA